MQFLIFAILFSSLFSVVFKICQQKNIDSAQTIMFNYIVGAAVTWIPILTGTAFGDSTLAALNAAWMQTGSQRDLASSYARHCTTPKKNSGSTCGSSLNSGIIIGSLRSLACLFRTVAGSKALLSQLQMHWNRLSTTMIPSWLIWKKSEQLLMKQKKVLAKQKLPKL